MKKILLLSLFCLLSINLFSQKVYDYVFDFKNESQTVIKDVVSEDRFKDSIRIETQSGNVFVFKVEDIKILSKIANDVITYQNNRKQSRAISYRSPAMATWLALIPGVGQYYNGQYGKGNEYLVWGLSSYSLLTLYIISVLNNSKGNSWDNFPMGGIIIGINTLAYITFSMMDANKSAKYINEKKGFINIRTSEKTLMSFNPDIKLQNHHNKLKVVPTYGLSLKFSF